MAWSGTRHHDHADRIDAICPGEIMGARRHRSTSDAAWGPALDIEIAKADKLQILGRKRDRTKCFNRFGHHVTQVFHLLGAASGFVDAMHKMYAGFRRRFLVGRAASALSFWDGGCLVQGCSLSVDLCVILFAVLAVATKVVAPSVRQIFFVDDSKKWACLQFAGQLDLAQPLPVS